MEAIPLRKQLAMGKAYPKSISGESKKLVDKVTSKGKEDSPKKVKMPKGTK